MVKKAFWNKVAVGNINECWPWLGKTRDGYGRVYLPGGRYAPATKIAWELFYKTAFPKGMMACHKCDNPCCVNPKHIFPGTAKDNTQDCINKDRRADQKGINNGNCKLTENEVHSIRKLYFVNNLPQKQIARMFRISKSQVHNIVRRKSWSDGTA